MPSFSSQSTDGYSRGSGSSNAFGTTIGSSHTSGTTIHHGRSVCSSEGITHSRNWAGTPSRSCCDDPDSEHIGWRSSHTYTGDFVRFPHASIEFDLSEFRQWLRRTAKHLTVAEFTALRQQYDAVFHQILHGKG